MNFKNIRQISIKELKSYFDHIGGYLLLGLFLAVTYFFFLRTFFLTSNASLRGMFELLPWVLAVFVPAVTMGSIAKEREAQTIEYLLTKPATTVDLVLGKIIGTSLFVKAGILFTLPAFYFVSQLGPIDLGETIAGYIGAVILAMSLSALGVGISSLFKNQISAFLTTIVIIMTLNLISTDFAAVNLSLNIAATIAQLSIIDHYFSLVRGVVEIQDLVYFSLLTLAGGVLSFVNIQKIRVPNVRTLIKKIAPSVAISFAIGGIIVYSSTFAQGRIDLTSNHKYTLSPVTREILRKEGKIKITVYASQELPTQYQNVLQELNNVLDDYKMAGGSKISVNYASPQDNQEKLQALGISPVQFNVIGQDQFQIKQGYLAVVIADDSNPDDENPLHEIIPFVQDVSNIEYSLTSLINKIKSPENITIAFASGNGEKSIFENYTGLRQLFGDEYQITTVFLPPAGEDAKGTSQGTQGEDSTDFGLDQYKLVVLAVPQTAYTDEAQKALEDYLSAGGSVLYMSEGIDLNTDFLTAAVPEPPAARGQIFKDYGITINNDLVYDLSSNTIVSFNAGNQFISIPYPFFVRAQKTDQTPSGMPSTILLPWASSLNIEQDKNWQILYQTSAQGGGTQTANFNLSPDQNLAPGGSSPLVALLNTKNGGQLAVIGNTQFMDDSTLQRSQENIVFTSTLFEILTQSQGFSQIRAKDLLNTQFTLQSEQEKYPLKYGAPVISLILLGAIGTSRFIRRRNLGQMI